MLLQLRAEIGQVEIPVAHRTHLGHFPRKRGNGLDQVFRVELMTKVAFVRISFLGFAALHGTVAKYLAAVQERADFGVVELKGFHKGQMPVFMQTTQHAVRDQLMHLARTAYSAAFVDGKIDVVRIERRLLGVVIALYVVTDRAFKAFVLARFAIPLLDRRAKAVGSGDEQHVIATKTVAQKARVRISGNKNARNMAKV